MLIRFADDNFTENHVTTIGVDFRFRSLELDGSTVKLQIWDTAGQERYKTITNSYYRNAEGVIIVFDLTNKESFLNIKDWLAEAKNGISDDTEILIFGNKADLADHRQVEDKEIREFTENTGIQIITCSAKSGRGVEEGFIEMTRRLMAKKQDSDEEEEFNYGAQRLSELKKLRQGESSDEGASQLGCC